MKALPLLSPAAQNVAAGAGDDGQAGGAVDIGGAGPGGAVVGEGVAGDVHGRAEAGGGAGQRVKGGGAVDVGAAGPGAAVVGERARRRRPPPHRTSVSGRKAVELFGPSRQFAAAVQASTGGCGGSFEAVAVVEVGGRCRPGRWRRSSGRSGCSRRWWLAAPVTAWVWSPRVS